MEETENKEQEVAEPAAKEPTHETGPRAFVAPTYPKVAGMKPEDWESVASPRRRRR